MQVSYEADSEYTYGSSSSDPKEALLNLLSSGVGKGYYTSNRVTSKSIKKAIAELEAAESGRREIKFPADFEDLDGRWKLMYSSNIMGVGRLSPLTLDTVYQVIDTAANSVKNVVYATLSPPMFVETWGRFPVAAVANGARRLHNKATIAVDFSLDHSFEISSMEYPAQLKIALKETKLLNCEKPEMRSLALPAIRPLAKAGAGKFDTTYLDSDLRVSRGSFGEVRVFQRSDEEHHSASSNSDSASSGSSSSSSGGGYDFSRYDTPSYNSRDNE